MRMKKLMILAAVAAIAATACTKTFEVEPTPANTIGFGTWANVLTKARTAGSSTFADGDDFNVYGFKTTTAANTTVFDGDVVAYDGTDWAYTTGLRFWDTNASSYTFYAVSPAGNVASANAQTGAFTSSSITFAGNDNDILVADKTTVAKGSSPYFSNYGKVNLSFNHIASLVDFKVKKHSDITAATVAITSFQISNIDKTGTFSVASTYATSNHPDVTWTPTARDTYDNESGVTSVNPLPSDIGTSGDDFLINHLVAMPQTFRTDSNIQTVTIEYTITSGGDTIENSATFNLKTFDNVDDEDNNDTLIGGWEGGKHYTFYITINANAIEFTATIANWVTTGTDGYHYLLQ